MAVMPLAVVWPSKAQPYWQEWQKAQVVADLCAVVSHVLAHCVAKQISTAQTGKDG